MRYKAPLDPECPAVIASASALLDDPMTKAMGAPTDEIIADYARKHRRECERCHDYGLANIEVE
ncbi:hypothetical protein [Bradyrhizobium ivorense]|uniref:hypothetical protein n=1 Tax=Bradyrhizobium ivorense TaxID=2511166 RepID=UPI0010BA4B0F|nr:hypothetical protein [Bradyrhizobium ivorense]VIO80093.1 hypothetical protein CI41S_70530 [Bradyrhizobium ivorense]